MNEKTKKKTHDALVRSPNSITKFAFLDGSFLSANRNYKIKRNYSIRVATIEIYNEFLVFLSRSRCVCCLAACLFSWFMYIYVCVCECMYVSFIVSFFTTLSLLLLLLLFFLRWTSIEWCGALYISSCLTANRTKSNRAHTQYTAKQRKLRETNWVAIFTKWTTV